jgi:hypothetical protein
VRAWRDAKKDTQANPLIQALFQRVTLQEATMCLGEKTELGLLMPVGSTWDVIFTHYR